MYLQGVQITVRAKCLGDSLHEAPLTLLTEESGDNKIRGGLLELVVDDDGGRRSMGGDFGFG